MPVSATLCIYTLRPPKPPKEPTSFSVEYVSKHKLTDIQHLLLGPSEFTHPHFNVNKDSVLSFLTNETWAQPRCWLMYVELQSMSGGRMVQDDHQDVNRLVLPHGRCWHINDGTFFSRLSQDALSLISWCSFRARFTWHWNEQSECFCGVKTWRYVFWVALEKKEN